MKFKKVISSIVMAALLCMNILPAMAAISRDSYSLSQVQFVSGDGPVTTKVAFADDGDTAAYDKITTYINGAEVASGNRDGDNPTAITIPAGTLVPGESKVTLRATNNGELYKEMTYRINAYREVDDAVTDTGADYDDISSISTSSTAGAVVDSLGVDKFWAVGQNGGSSSAFALVTENGNNYIKYTPKRTASSTAVGSAYLRLEWGATRERVYNDGIIKLSADIYVPDSDTIKSISTYTSYDSTGSCKCTDIQNYLKVGQWNKVHYLFNVDKHSLSYYVENSGGNVIAWTRNSTEFKINSSKPLRSEMVVNDNKWIGIDNVKLEHLSGDYEILNITAPTEAVNTAELSIRPYLAGEVKTYVDGALASTDTAVAGQEITKNITVASCGEGIKNVRVVATLADGKTYAKYAKINLSKCAENGIGTASGNIIDFNSLSSSYSDTVIDDTVAASLESNFGLITTSAADRTITRIDGKNHANDENDYAALYSFGSVSSTEYSGTAAVELANAQNQRDVLEAKGGKFVVEFDLMFYDSTPTLYLYLPFGLWGDTDKGQFLLKNGNSKLRETDVTVSKDAWHSYKLEYDIASDKWSVLFDGSEVKIPEASSKENTTFTANTTVKLQIIRKPSVTNKFALDNLRVYHIYEGASVEAVTYGSGTAVDYTIPCGQQTVSVKLDKAVSGTTNQVLKNGVLSEDFTVATSDNITYTVSGNFEANSEYEILIGGISVPLCVTDADGVYVKICELEYADGEVLARAESLVPEDKSVNFITAIYSDDTLLAIKAGHLDSLSEMNYTARTLTCPQGATKAKAMLWTGSIPHIASEGIAITE